MKIYMIRHGKTAGNLKGRYIGTTDEPLCEEGRAELKGARSDLQSGADTVSDVPANGGPAKGGEDFPAPDMLFVSPLLRCRQTATLLFPGVPQTIVEDFRECDFGAFENKNYLELSGNADYQAWIDSGGTLPFPGGESREDFQRRCVRAFQSVLHTAAQKGFCEIACVVHGGTIMSVLSALALPRRGYYDYQAKNGCGYLIEWKEGERADAVICRAEMSFAGGTCREIQ